MESEVGGWKSTWMNRKYIDGIQKYMDRQRSR